MDKNAEAAKEALEMTLALGEIPVFQNSFEERFVNKGKEKVEQLESAVAEAQGASSSTSWNPFPRFIHSRRLSKAHNELEGFQSKAVLPVFKVVQNIHKLLQGQEQASCLASVSLFSCPPVSPTQPVVGISDLVSRLKSALLDARSPQWIIVTGAGGMGKFFLVEIVCNTQEVRDYFDILWLSFSHDCLERDQLLIQRDLFVRLSRQQQVGHIMTLSSGNNALQDLIMRQQQRKPYLLVLDNVWSRPTVENFDFLMGSERSKVIVTSRYQDIVSQTDGTVIKMSGLSMEDAYRLFCKYAFNGTDNAPADHVRKFIGHCGGNPLMLKVLGKFMRGKSLPVQWEYVLLEIERRKRSHEVHEHVFQILRLSYDALDPMDQNRFLFLASVRVDSTGYAMEDLSEMIFYCWRGLHFLSYDDNMEMAWEEYDNALETLCSASLVGGYSKLQVPELLVELADYIIRKDNLSNSTRYRKATPSLPQSPLSSVGMMTIFGPVSDNYFNYFPNLRALHVRDFYMPIRVLGAYILSGVIELRYLEVGYVVLDVSMATALCESLKQLSRLESLSIHGRAAEEIIFDLGFLECMPNLTRLHIQVEHLDGVIRLINSHHIPNLTKLVRLAIGAEQVMRISVDSDRFFSSLSTCTRLKELQIYGLPVAFNRFPAEIHWPHLTTLNLEVAMQCLPNTWLQSLPRLENLWLNGGGVLVAHPPLDKLPRLRCLVLSKLAGDHISFTPDEQTSLAHLEWLEIEDCVNLVDVELPDQTATLEYLQIIDCKKLIRLPSSMLEMKHLPLTPFKLEFLSISNCAEMETILADDTQFPVCFPNLKFLTLKDLPKLVHVQQSTLIPLVHLYIYTTMRGDEDDTTRRHTVPRVLPEPEVPDSRRLAQLVRVPPTLGPECKVRLDNIDRNG